MTAVEITLIIVGIVFLLVSFLVQEKLSPKDIESITNLSENELKIIVEKQLKIYQNQTTIDLLEVRDFVYTKFINAYEFRKLEKEL